MYDITVIGTGPGGYAAAVRAAQLDAKVCVVEKDLLGGVCLNRGCIPTKTIKKSAEILRGIKRSSEYGIATSGYNLDIKNLLIRKSTVVSRLRNAVKSQLDSNNIDIIKGRAEFCDNTVIKVDGRTISSRYIIVATGSSVAELPGIKPDHKCVLSTDDILDLDRIPKSIIIIGGGVIGCEFASLYNEFGSKVTVIELMNQLLPNGDREIGRRLEAAFKKSGIEVIKNSRVVSVDIQSNARVHLEGSKQIEAEVVLVSVGRQPNIEGLNLEKAGLKTINGNITVDEKLMTNIPNVYAVGDVIGGYLLAHVASYEGRLAAENILGRSREADYSAVPNCIFTTPEIASVGVGEEKAKRLGLSICVTRVPLAAISKAHVMGETEGFIKLISDAKSDTILGSHIFGTFASELITDFAIAISLKTKVKELGRVIYPHPTLSEGIGEAARRITD